MFSKLFLFCALIVFSLMLFIRVDQAFAFDPTSIGGLQIWLKADQGVYQDTGKTTNATYNILDWADQSGNGRDATSTIFASPFITTTATSSAYFEANYDNDPPPFHQIPDFLACG
jgi:hypothetical protein